MEKGFNWLIETYKGEERTNALLIVQFSLIAGSLSLFYATVHPYVNIHAPRWIFFGLPLALLVNVISLSKRWLAVTQLAQFTVALFWAAFMVGVSYSGGMYSMVLPWLAPLPLLALLLVDHRAAVAWLVICVGSVLFFTFSSQFTNAAYLRDENAPVRLVLSVVGLMAILSSFAYMFYRSNRRMLREITTKNEELERQKGEILAQNEFINKQNVLLTQQKKQIEFANAQLTEKVAETNDRNERMEKYWHLLLELSKSRPINFGGFEEAMKHITKHAAESLDTSRVSVWSYHEERGSIQCLVLYDRAKGTHVQEEELLLTQFPRYFQALRVEEVIPADEARLNPHTFEFKQAYLEPRHIFSMMDTPYFMDGQLAGVLCCEHVDSTRHWTPEDILFAQALSDIITLAFRANQRRDYERNIRQHRREIVRMNQTLEQRVKERTQELETQNKQLTEYAYINSHLLRGPLSRILGLINLIDYTGTRDEKEKELIQHLRQSGDELDHVVRKINDAILDGNELSRETINKKEQK
ncbi:MAG: GAF domain-containing protein [Bacteroidota bacterium]